MDAVTGNLTLLVDNNGRVDEGLATKPLDPLALDIEDKELVDILDKRIEASRNFYEGSEYHLYERREENEMYLFGRQIRALEEERELKDYESRYNDNALYEIEATIKPLAMSRLPDLLVTPGNDSEQSVLMAQEVSKCVDTEIKEQNNRSVLGLAFKHLPVYFTGVIKVRWDPEIDDYLFEVIHPELIDVDNTCPDNNADHMEFVSQIIPLSVEEVVMRFPRKKDDFFIELKKDGLKVNTEGGKQSWIVMATKVKIREVWFTWYKKKNDTEWERIEGVLWKYKECILKKMKNPNFDYEGEQRYFAYDDMENESTKRPLGPGELGQIFMTGSLPDNVLEEQVYHNYFKYPRKPFYFMSYDKWGKQPYDETSRIEQNLQNQKTLDKRGKQIEETLDQRGHNVFSKESGLTAQDVEELDMNDPDQDLVVAGDVNATHKYIEPPRPAAQEFTEKENILNRMYSLSGSNAVRGNIKSGEAATTNQIARESDFTRADDLVEDTINAAASWMAEWALQMIKLRYTKDHFRYVLGAAGEMVWEKLNRNMIDDGMIVKIKASGTDKLRAQNNAMDMAKMEMIDPYTFFVDMNLSDPEGRTEKLILAKTDPIAYLQKVVKGINTSQALAEALARQQLPSPAVAPPAPPQMNPVMGQQNAMNQPVPGAAPQGMPQNPTPTNTAAAPVAPPVGPPPGSPRGL